LSTDSLLRSSSAPLALSSVPTRRSSDLSYTIGLGYGAMLVFDNVISLGNLVTFNVYLGMLIWRMFAVGELINVMQRGNASLDRVERKGTRLNSSHVSISYAVVVLNKKNE